MMIKRNNGTLILNELKLEFPKGTFYGYDPIVNKVDLMNFGLKHSITIEDALKDQILL